MAGLRAVLTGAFLLACFALSDSAVAQPGAHDPSGAETIEQTCRKYADDAVAQYNENIRLKCGGTGPRWSGDKETHYQWCLATRANMPNTESRARQDSLKSCLTAACSRYANRAIQQQQENLRHGCGYSGSRWSENFDHHFRWCERIRYTEGAENENRARDADLARCGMRKPLDGDFSVKSVTPRFGGSGDSRFVSQLDIAIEADSAQPWIIGGYGHRRFGSLWAEVTVSNKIAPNDVIQSQDKTYLFSIRGTAAQTPSFITPHPGMQVPGGRQTVTLSVAPMPRPQLLGVEQMFSVPSQPFGPGELGCWYDYPEVTVKVFIVTTANTATVRTGTTGPVYDAVLKRIFVEKKGGFGEGVVYEACR